MAAHGADAPLKHLVIATRGSTLARVQTDSVIAHLNIHHPGLTTEVRVIKTTGDASQEASLTELGLGVFTKELEVELLSRRADLAVHSLKDMSTEAPAGLEVLSVMKREDARDQAQREWQASQAGENRRYRKWELFFVGPTLVAITASVLVSVFFRP